MCFFHMFLNRLCWYKGVQGVEGILYDEHVNMCMAIPAKYSVFAITGYLNGNSAIILFEISSRLKRNLRGHSF